MPLSQMLSPSWQMIKVLSLATDPNVLSRSASPKVTTTLHVSTNLVWKIGTSSRTSVNTRRLSSSQPLCRGVHQLRSLAVSRHDNLGARAARDGRRDEVSHRRPARGVSTRQESQYTGRVVHALDRKTAGTSQPAGERIEERRTLGSGFANVAGAIGAARVDDGDGAARGAVGQLVEGVAVVLALGDGV